MSSSRIPVILIAILVACEPTTPSQPAMTPPAPPMAASPTQPPASPSSAPAPTPSPATPPRDGEAPDIATPARGRIVVTESDECGLILDSLYFPDNSAVLAAPQDQLIAATAEMFRCFLRTHEVMHWQVIGHADVRERDPARLGLDRGNAVAKALIARGVPPDSLEVVSAGANDPADLRGTSWARAKNRRVTFLVPPHAPH